MEPGYNFILTYLLLILYICVASGRIIAPHTQVSTVRTRRHAPIDNSKLCKAFGCVNGHCKESELRNFRIVCECFPGYGGKLCDRLKCPYDCGQHGTCSRKGRILYCKCDEGYYGAKCDSFAQKVEPRSFVGSKTLMEALGGLIMQSDGTFKAKDISGANNWFTMQSKPVNQIKFTDFHSHAEIDTSVKPDVCAPGFQCYHGKCDRDAMADGMFQCLCKPNFTGLFCEKRCTLKCQNDGQCMVLQDGHQLCSCPFNFTGHYCQKPL